MIQSLCASRAAELLMQRDNITLLCHRRPDGDTVGSAFALYYALRQLGKEVRVLCADPLPEQYRYLYGPDYTPSRVLWSMWWRWMWPAPSCWESWSRNTAGWWISALITTPAIPITPP